MRRPPFPRPALLLALATCTGAAHAQEGQTYWYVEDGGVVAFEIEDGPQTGAWTTLRDPSALGSGYLRWDGAFGGPDSSEGRRLRYRFVVGEPGNYELRWRSRIDKGDENTEHNDSWVRFPTGTDVPDEEPLPGWTKVFMNRLEGWSWQSATVDHVGRPVRQHFAAGEHEFEIAARSDGHALDRVVLYRYETLDLDDGDLDRLPVSATTTDPGGVADAGGTTGGDGTDGSTGGDTGGDTGGGTDGQVDGGPDGDGSDGGSDGAGGDGGATDPVGTMPPQAAGTCEADRLVLAPTGASTPAAPRPDGAPTGLVAGTDSLVWLSFDLSRVPPPQTASLRITPAASTDGPRTLTSWLGSGADVDAPPDPTVSLGSLDAALVTGTGIAPSLDASLLGQAVGVGIGIGFVDAGDPLSIAGPDAETPGQRPALVLAGGAGFCEDRERLLRETGEYGPVGQTPVDAVEAGADTGADTGADAGDDAGTDAGGRAATDAPEASDAKRGSGSGSLGGTSLLALALAWVGGARRRRLD